MKLAKIALTTILALTLIGCKNENKEPQIQTDMTTKKTESNEWTDIYTKIEAKKIPKNIIELIGEDWMLVTAGNKESFNTMTASWGGMGFLWERPVSFITIRDIRYTYQFLEREEGYTLSFFAEEHKGALKICGTKSGRDTDKVKEAGLNSIITPSGLVSFKEAILIVECKKMFVEPMDLNSLTKNYKETIEKDFYSKEEAKHTLFISEITNVWVKN